MATRYISCSCNAFPHCADWGNNGLICFGTCNAIAIYEPGIHIGRVTHTLHRHRDHVNTVQWIKPGNGKPESEFLSSSADGTAIIWSKLSGEETFQDTAVLHMDSNVQFADSLHLSDVPADIPETTSVSPKLLICTGSTNSEIKIWLREEDRSAKCIQSIPFGNKLVTFGRLAYLLNIKRPLLAAAIEDSSISLYVRESDALESSFTLIHKLTGHDDTIRCIEFAYNNDGDILLATGAQDRLIRLWKIDRAVKSSSEHFQLEKDIFTVDGKEYNVLLESILEGHEDWIYGIHWQPVKSEEGQAMRLLSSSMDKSMIVWELDESNAIWIEKVRVGIVGGNIHGFYGCKFSPDGLHILGYDYQNSFHIWKYSEETATWMPRSTPGGHFSEVVDLCWEPKGRFFITASKDQTAKIHAPWKDDDSKELWHEIARPQVHGYDMTCLGILAPDMYASGADEKVVRVFTATSAFRDRLKRLTNVEDFKSTLARGATVPSLGLTNKATFDEQVKQCKEENSTDGMYQPPTEEELAQNTLWPETKKLYGHGYEVFCMAARYDGQLLATACRSSNEQYSAIILWSTDTWLKVQELAFHKLTVTQLAFSRNNKYLLSVSRDRRWSLFKETDGKYALLSASSKDKSHSRIIWCCGWAQDSSYFATGSRDGKVCVWSVKKIETDPNSVTPETTLDTKDQSVTALCFAPSCNERQSYTLAIGYESGRIDIYTVMMNAKNEWVRLVRYDTTQAHHLTVKRLMFRPTEEHASDTLQMASCGSDHIVKIFDIDLPSLLTKV